MLLTYLLHKTNRKLDIVLLEQFGEHFRKDAIQTKSEGRMSQIPAPKCNIFFVRDIRDKASIGYNFDILRLERCSLIGKKLFNPTMSILVCVGVHNVRQI